MPKQDDGWGSRPVPGRDWGTSTRCNEASLKTLLELVEKSTLEAGVRDSFDGPGLLMPDCAGPSCLPTLQFEPVSDHTNTQIQVLAASSEIEVQVKPMEVDTSSPAVADERELRRRHQKFRKLKRMSVFMSASQPDDSAVLRQSALFHRHQQPLLATHQETSSRPSLGANDFAPPQVDVSLLESELLPSLVKDKKILAGVFAFLSEGELLMTASLVCYSWAEAAAMAHADLMLACVGQIGNGEDPNDVEDDEDFNSDTEDVEGFRSSTMRVPGGPNSIVASLERPWKSLLTTFPHGKFLAEGGFKKVFQVLNASIGLPEAVSVM